MSTTKKITAISLFSGGLDSILASTLVASLGVRVQAVKFISPFFGYHLLGRKAEHEREVKETYGIDLTLVDISAPYLELLKNPAHGFGKHFNPCVDCKIFLLSRAREMMREYNASFIFTGEVIGQRPMSQRRDTLFLIERESGCRDFLLRPLCAKNLPMTKAEEQGLIDRERLLDFNGRNRTPQMELAKKMGITKFPSPSGGCILADPILSKRIKQYYADHDTILAQDILLLLTGRQFMLPGGGWLAVGRDEKENIRLLSGKIPGDVEIYCTDRTGPAGILRNCRARGDFQAAAGIIVRYAKKGGDLPETAEVAAYDSEGTATVYHAPPLDDEVFKGWQR